MEQKNKRTEERNLLPFHIIKAAIRRGCTGDPGCIEAL